jgi:hypothetical protein
VYAVKKKIFRGNKVVLNQTGVKKNEIAQWACVAWRWLSALENFKLPSWQEWPQQPLILMIEYLFSFWDFFILEKLKISELLHE